MKSFRGSKYPLAEPVALRLLAPQRGLFATVRSKSRNKSKSLVLPSSLPQHGQFEGEHTPGILKVLPPPRQSRGISLFGLDCDLSDQLQVRQPKRSFFHSNCQVLFQAGCSDSRELCNWEPESWETQAIRQGKRRATCPRDFLTPGKAFKSRD